MSAGTMHTISSHTGKQYERGLLPSAPVTTLPHPGVEVVDGHEPDSVGGTGLSSRPSAQSNVKSRKPAKQLPARMGPVWKCVTITGKEYDTCPYVKCKFCGKDFSDGATRIANHLTGNGMTECADQSELQGEVRGVGLRLRLRRERRRERPEGLSARIARQGSTAALIAATAAQPDGGRAPCPRP